MQIRRMYEAVRHPPDAMRRTRGLGWTRRLAGRRDCAETYSMQRQSQRRGSREDVVSSTATPLDVLPSPRASALSCLRVCRLVGLVVEMGEIGLVGAVGHARALISRDRRDPGSGAEVCERDQAVFCRWIGDGIGWLRGCSHGGT